MLLKKSIYSNVHSLLSPFCCT